MVVTIVEFWEHTAVDLSQEENSLSLSLHENLQSRMILQQPQWLLEIPKLRYTGNFAALADTPPPYASSL
jgi:hypothetical protein